MEKQTITKFGKTYYLLGVNDENEKVWLEQSSFDCGWYWGIGYLEIFNKNYTDINYHFHLESILPYTKFDEYFKETTLSDSEKWEFLELYNTLYTLRKYSDLLHTGSSHIANNIFKDDIQNNDEYKKINHNLIPNILTRVYVLLGGIKND